MILLVLVLSDQMSIIKISHQTMKPLFHYCSYDLIGDRILLTKHPQTSLIVVPISPYGNIALKQVWTPSIHREELLQGVKSFECFTSRDIPLHPHMKYIGNISVQKHYQTCTVYSLAVQSTAFPHIVWIDPHEGDLYFDRFIFCHFTKATVSTFSDLVSRAQKTSVAPYN